MSFLDRLLRRPGAEPSVAHTMIPTRLPHALIKTGKWVWVEPHRAVGILTSAQQFPTLDVMLTDAAGANLKAIKCGLGDVRLARHSEIPAPRRPSADIAASLGYHA